MIDGMFQAGTDAVLDDQVQRPNPYKPPEVKFGVGQFLNQGVVRPIGSGAVAKPIAFAADILGAFGDVAGAGGFNQGGMFSTPTPEERKQQEAARAKWIDSSPNYSSETGDIFRQRAKELMPDPTQTHAATQVMAGVVEFGANAVAYAAATGPAAPFLVGGDAALSESDKLKQQGVDLATRTKAGAVQGVSAGAAIALPVVGVGLKSTAALVAAGGPGTFIAQNATERAILANAGYEKIASQYDPLDPVGLALSTLVPAGFGAVALRARAKPAPTLKEVVLGIESNGQRYAKDGSVLTSPKGAKGEMQVMDGTNLDPGYGVRPAADNSLAERARVGSDYLDAMLKRYGSEDKAMAAYNAGPGALDAALAKGGDWLGRMPAETQAYVKKGMAKLGEGRTAEAARATIARDPEAVAAARVRQTADTLDSYRLTPDNDLAGMSRHQDAIETAHEQMARGEPVSVSDMLARSDVAARAMEPGSLSPFREGPHYRVQSLAEYTPRLYRETSVENATGFFPGSMSQSMDLHFANDPAYALGQGGNKGVRLEFDAEGMPGQINLSKPSARQSYDSGYAEFITRDAYPETLTSKLRAVTVGADQQTGPYFRRLQSSLKAEGFVAGPKGANGELTFTRAVPDRPAALASALAKAFEPAPTSRVESTPATGKQMLAAAGESPIKPAPKAGGEGGGTPDAAALDAQTAAVDPDLMVQLEGMDKPMRVSELLEQVKKEAADETRDASLVEVAANCFLGGA